MTTPKKVRTTAITPVDMTVQLEVEQPTVETEQPTVEQVQVTNIETKEQPALGSTVGWNYYPVLICDLMGKKSKLFLYPTSGYSLVICSKAAKASELEAKNYKSIVAEINFLPATCQLEVRTFDLFYKDTNLSLFAALSTAMKQSLPTLRPLLGTAINTEIVIMAILALYGTKKISDEIGYLTTLDAPTSLPESIKRHLSPSVIANSELLSYLADN